MANSLRQEKIKSVSVSGLFRRFNHEIRFDDENDIVIVTAPNGFGKTAMLRIIDSIFSKRLSLFWKLSFDEIVVRLQSGKQITIGRQTQSLFPEEIEKENPGLFISAEGFGDEDAFYELPSSATSKNLRMLERRLPIEQTGPDTWLDYSSDQYLSTAEVIDLYGVRLSDRTRGALQLPEQISVALASIETHLVETQRLLALNEKRSVTSRRESRNIKPPSVVEKDAADLAVRIGEVLQEYANQSQQLDQSFPKRIIEFKAGHVTSQPEIKKRLQKLNEKRDELVSAGLIGASIGAPIASTDSFPDEQVRKILSIYIEDTEQKLSVFDEMYKKIRIFKEILDEHFSFKKISISPKHGIQAIDQDTGEVIPLSELSSGEQHELVLIYELLFKVKDGSLILIDEPELSLHVAWQKRFISDLQKIQKLKPLEVIIATHSPQIINDRWDLVQELSA